MQPNYNFFFFSNLDIQVYCLMQCGKQGLSLLVVVCRYLGTLILLPFDRFSSSIGIGMCQSFKFMSAKVWPMDLFSSAATLEAESCVY